MSGALKEAQVTSSVLRVQHTSLQYSDTKAQQEHDVRQLFVRGQRFPIKTGTEGSADTFSHDALRYIGSREFNHAVHIVRGNWIAVDRDIIEPKSLDRGQEFVIKNDFVVGRMHDRILATVEFDHRNPRIGHIGVGSAHYPRRGRLPSDPNNDVNELYADVIAKWMQETAKGPNLAFVHGDFNMLDNKKRQDWSFGNNWTSMADELKAWANTGHGPIDGFASYDRDGRVKAKKFWVLDDSELKMFSDHYVVRGVWEVGHLKLNK